MLGNEKFIELAKEKVVDYFNSRVEKTDRKQIAEADVFVVWDCFILGHQKALLSTTVSDGMYYEVTFNSNKNEMYFDAYKKWENICYKLGVGADQPTMTPACQEDKIMKRLFVSQPMNGLAEEEILKAREEILKKVEKKVGEPLLLIDSYFPEDPKETVKNKGAWYLGKSLMKLSEADIAYFGKGWENARGCKIEHSVAVAYGIEVIAE